MAFDPDRLRGLRFPRLAHQQSAARSRPGRARHRLWRSGDVGSTDAEGYLKVFDRKKDMVNRTDYKVYAAEVEGVIVSHPDVSEAAIVGYPDPVLGSGWRHSGRGEGPVPGEHPRLLPRTPVRLQGAGPHHHPARRPAAERQWQGRDKRTARNGSAGHAGGWGRMMQAPRHCLTSGLDEGVRRSVSQASLQEGFCQHE